MDIVCLSEPEALSLMNLILLDDMIISWLASWMVVINAQLSLVQYMVWTVITSIGPTNMNWLDPLIAGR